MLRLKYPLPVKYSSANGSSSGRYTLMSIRRCSEGDAGSSDAGSGVSPPPSPAPPPPGRSASRRPCTPRAVARAEIVRQQPPRSEPREDGGQDLLETLDADAARRLRPPPQERLRGRDQHVDVPAPRIVPPERSGEVHRAPGTRLLRRVAHARRRCAPPRPGASSPRTRPRTPTPRAEAGSGAARPRSRGGGARRRSSRPWRTAAARCPGPRPTPSRGRATRRRAYRASAPRAYPAAPSRAERPPSSARWTPSPARTRGRRAGPSPARARAERRSRRETEDP